MVPGRVGPGCRLALPWLLAQWEKLDQLMEERCISSKGEVSFLE